jgi:hypothetical protein
MGYQMSSPYELAKMLCAAQLILDELESDKVVNIDEEKIKLMLVRLKRGVAYLEKLHGKCDKNILDER